MTNELITKIESIKLELAKMANDNQDINDYNQIKFKENIDITDQILFVRGYGKQLKQLLEAFQHKLVNLNISEGSKNQIYKLLNTDATPMIDGKTMSWESEKFEHFPVVSAIATLSSIQVNVLASECIVIQK
jgi:hypothetical protein